MTIIACRVNKGSIEIASDDQTSWGTFMKYPVKSAGDNEVKQNGKLWQINGFTVGCAGSCSDIGLLQVFLKTHQPKNISRDSVLEWVIEFKEWVNSKTKIPVNSVSVHGIMIYKGKAITFFDHLEVYPITKFDAVGSGMHLAIGAMDIGATASEAVKVAIKYGHGCGGKLSKIIIKK